MLIQKCDICRKAMGVADANLVSVRFGYDRKDLCSSCGKPVIQFLKKKKLIGKEKRLKSTR